MCNLLQYCGGNAAVRVWGTRIHVDSEADQKEQKTDAQIRTQTAGHLYRTAREEGIQVSWLLLKSNKIFFLFI